MADCVERAPAALDSLARGPIGSLAERLPPAPLGLRGPRESASDATVDAEVRSSARSRDEPTRALRCVACGHLITHEQSMIEVAGRHGHSCVNPAGITYRIGCFRDAPGVVGVGSWSSFFTWFAGHLWQVGCCESCSMHLGWLFEPEREPSPARRFYGLIRNRLCDQPPRDTGA